MPDQRLKRCSTPVKRAEQAIVRAAIGIVNPHGWAFSASGEVHFPHAMRRLENAIHRLKEARKNRRKK